LSEQVHRLLITEKKALSFVPGRRSKLSPAAAAPVPIRNREAASADLRKPEIIAPIEMRAAILAVIDVGHGATKQEIPSAVARMLGFKNTSAQLRSTLERQANRLLRAGAVTESNGLLKRADSSANSIPPHDS
jgi:hypothetical protein